MSEALFQQSFEAFNILKSNIETEEDEQGDIELLKIHGQTSEDESSKFIVLSLLSFNSLPSAFMNTKLGRYIETILQQTICSLGFCACRWIFDYEACRGLRGYVYLHPTHTFIFFLYDGFHKNLTLYSYVEYNKKKAG